MWLRKAHDWITATRAAKATDNDKDTLIWDRLPWAERLALELLEREAGKSIEDESPNK